MLLAYHPTAQTWEEEGKEVVREGCEGGEGCKGWKRGLCVVRVVRRE